MRIIFPVLFLVNICLAQSSISLNYYLPDEAYNTAIPTPMDILGFEIGEQHISHDQMVRYMEKVAASSDRVTMEVYARTFEKRPLILLKISKPEWQSRLEAIREKRKDAILANSSVEEHPEIVYMGYSVHGNEASGGNAAMLMLYYLAASNSERVDAWLENKIILLDPCFNPDGFNRFASWVNMHSSMEEISDNKHREYDEVWPGGRTNHYWFDLNRDWLPVQLPESRGRVANFHKWMPNVLTDHHEMGTNATFFFQPGIPSRNNPNTPANTITLTEKIGGFHAKALDSIGSLYYSKESYDDFYYGKGSTFPDINGAVGILFEQASSRGSAQQSIHGILRFPFTIKNQLTTSFSTLDASTALGRELMDHMATFYKEAQEEGGNSETKAYVLGSNDPHRVKLFTDMLRVHEIDYHALGKPLSLEGTSYEPESSILIPTSQRQYRLLKVMMEKVTAFNDSLFYDVSAWTLPLAFGLEYAPYSGKGLENYLGEKNVFPETPSIEVKPDAYAYLIPWHYYYSVSLLDDLQQRGIKVKVATEPFIMASGEQINSGSLIIARQHQETPMATVGQYVKGVATKYQVPVLSEMTGLAQEGPFLGSRTIEPVRMPKIAIAVGEGISAYDAGEVWHLLDSRFGIKATLLDVEDMRYGGIDSYNVLILVNGRYSISQEDLKSWLREGNVLIAYENAVKWLAGGKVIDVEFKKSEPDTVRLPEKNYANRDEFQGAQYIGGSIFETSFDATHPLLFGYHGDKLPVFRGHTNFMKLSDNPYANPLIYTADPLLSGYISKPNFEKLKNTAAIDVSAVGSGRVISFMDNTNFRAFWLGTNKLLVNAIFFGNLIDYGAAR